jgi:hypothetical protein
MICTGALASTPEEPWNWMIPASWSTCQAARLIWNSCSWKRGLEFQLLATARDERFIGRLRGRRRGGRRRLGLARRRRFRRRRLAAGREDQEEKKNRPAHFAR